MAVEPVTTSRRSLLGAAIALPFMAAAASPAASAMPVDGTDWSRRLFRFQRLHALLTASQKFGPHRHAYDDLANERAALESQYGSWSRALADPEGRARADRATTKSIEAEDRHYALFTRPADKAAVLLVLTPAPDMAAVEIKLAVIDEYDLDNYPSMSRPPFDLVRDDLQRLSAGRA